MKSIHVNPSRIAVIIVTFNSQQVLKRCIEALFAQSRAPDTVIVVDNASSDTTYLTILDGIPNHRVILLPDNQGFCRGNNRGLAGAIDCDYILFLNPDAFLGETFIEEAVAIMDDPANSRVGALSGVLLGFDVAAGEATGKWDSTGIFQTWYGKWYDRGQGMACEAWSGGPHNLESVPALCGALMFCRWSALREVLLRGAEVFDESFFMYKEDIDLSLRLRRKGWTVAFCRGLRCYHGRGWKGRGKMSALSKYLSARNELRVCFRNRGKGLVYSSLKFLFVCLVQSRNFRLLRVDPDGC
jgi:N-acetylglucosaminyl-diphospho-decaprenol L-rhamnosyltransferase